MSDILRLQSLLLGIRDELLRWMDDVDPDNPDHRLCLRVDEETVDEAKLHLSDVGKHITGQKLLRRYELLQVRIGSVILTVAGRTESPVGAPEREETIGSMIRAAIGEGSGFVKFLDGLLAELGWNGPKRAEQCLVAGSATGAAGASPPMPEHQSSGSLVDAERSGSGGERPPGNTDGQEGLEKRALQVLVAHDEITTKIQLEKRLGLKPKTLRKDRYPRLHSAIQARKDQGARKPPRGEKSADGKIEAWEEE